MSDENSVSKYCERNSVEFRFAVHKSYVIHGFRERQSHKSMHSSKISTSALRVAVNQCEKRYRLLHWSMCSWLEILTIISLFWGRFWKPLFVLILISSVLYRALFTSVCYEVFDWSKYLNLDTSYYDVFWLKNSVFIH